MLKALEEKSGGGGGGSSEPEGFESALGFHVFLSSGFRALGCRTREDHRTGRGCKQQFRSQA